MYSILPTFHQIHEQGVVAQLLLACFHGKVPTWSKPPTLMGTGASWVVFVADVSGVLSCRDLLSGGPLTMFVYMRYRHDMVD